MFFVCFFFNLGNIVFAGLSTHVGDRLKNWGRGRQKRQRKAFMRVTESQNVYRRLAGTWKTASSSLYLAIGAPEAGKHKRGDRGSIVLCSRAQASVVTLASGFSTCPSDPTFPRAASTLKHKLIVPCCRYQENALCMIHTSLLCPRGTSILNLASEKQRSPPVWALWLGLVYQRAQKRMI